MEIIPPNNKLSEEASDFFNRLKDYLDTKLYFYGSILRSDYIQGKSDIDVAIFTENETRTISQLSGFLHISKQKFKRIVIQKFSNSTLIHGYKITYDDEENSLKVEFSIYNEKNKSEILQIHLSKSNLPIHASVFLWILKTLFYHLQLISLESYRFLKNKALSLLIGIPENKFVKYNIIKLI